MPSSPPDDPWTQLLGELEGLLCQAELGPEDARSAVLQSMREVLRGLGLDETGASRRKAEVTVMEGGRGQDGPPTPRPRPQLRVAPREEPVLSELDDEPTVEDAVASARFFWLDSAPEELTNPGVDTLDDLSSLFEAGRIRVAGDSEPQTLYMGERARTYRITCTRGGLDVPLPDGGVARLHAGQSMDIEVRYIRVSASNGRSGEGFYVRL